MSDFFHFSSVTVLFGLLVFGLAWPIVARLPLAPAERILASVVASLVALWLYGWGIYVAGASWKFLWVLPPAALAGMMWRRDELRTVLRDANARALLIGQALIAAWCVGWLALVQSYSGGGWAADWVEHFERARFFIERLPRDTLFVGHYAMTARPPFANLITGMMLGFSRTDFATYQIVTTAFSCLAFLPAAALALRWSRDRRVVAILAVLCMISPLFMQNSTFPWTKLPSALFVLAALHFFLLRSEATTARCASILFSVSTAAALLAHYSAGPYAVMLGIGWFGFRTTMRNDSFLPLTVTAAAAGFAVLLTWAAWAIAVYGLSGTALSNTSVTTVDSNFIGQVGRIALNLWDTLVPHFLRSFDKTLMDQTSPWGFARDWFFQSYQLNLAFALGSLAWLVVVRECAVSWRSSAADTRNFWVMFVAGTIVLGVAAHGARDTWGLTHICLQPLVLVGVAFLASRWPTLPAFWRRVALAGAVVDLLCGVLLHFFVQNFLLDRWLTPDRAAIDVVSSYNIIALPNVLALGHNRLETLNQVLPVSTVLVLALLAVILILAVRRTRPS